MVEFRRFLWKGHPFPFETQHYTNRALPTFWRETLFWKFKKIKIDMNFFQMLAKTESYFTTSERECPQIRFFQGICQKMKCVIFFDPYCMLFNILHFEQFLKVVLLFSWKIKYEIPSSQRSGKPKFRYLNIEFLSVGLLILYFNRFLKLFSLVNQHKKAHPLKE